MNPRLALPVLCLILLAVIGCKATTRTCTSPSEDSPFVGQWEVQRLMPAEIDADYNEEFEEVFIILDFDGFACVSAAERDDDEMATLTGTWTQGTNKRIDLTFEVGDQTLTAHAWLIEPDTIRVIARVRIDGPDSIGGILTRVEEEEEDDD